MTRFITICALFVLTSIAVVCQADNDFDSRFTNATLRIDYHHTGAAGEEIVSLDRLFEEGPWPGPRVNLIDNLDLGRYQAKLLDAETGELLWSRGFDSYFGEWKTTIPAANGVRRTYHESILTPFPRMPVTFVLESRDKDTFIEVFRVDIDPATAEIRREPLDADITVIQAHVGCEPAQCVDVVILGDGYLASDADKFEKDLQHFADALLGQEPFASLKHKMAVRGVLKPSQERGCDEPTRGVHRNTALGCTFNSLGSTRYMLTEDNRAIRDAASAAPYDVLSIMANHTRYGGGGIYNLFNTFTSDNQWSDYVFVHEFGHGFAGLADEYYSSSTAYTDFYPAGIEPAERNITRMLDGKPKWCELLEPETGLPIDWNKAEYDAMDQAYQERRTEINARIAELMTGNAPQDEIDAAIAAGEDLSRTHQEKLDAWFAANPTMGTVGAFEGAGYSSQGMYRAELDCIMFTKGLKRFCAACSAGIQEVVANATDH
ncbi:MAG: M64 family metallopeptidase [Lysobacterales bacterium]